LTASATRTTKTAGQVTWFTAHARRHLFKNFFGKMLKLSDG